jgi:hypothetical protein
MSIFAVTVNDLRDKNLFSMEARDVNYLSFEKDDKRLVFNRHKDAGWMIVEPVQWKSDDFIVQEAVKNITALKIQAFAAAAFTNLNQVGLDAPAAIVRIMDHYPEGTNTVGQNRNSKSEHHSLMIGSLLDDGKKVFVKFEDEPLRFGDGATVFAVSSSGIKRFIDSTTDPLVYRDRTMLAVPKSHIKRVTLLKDGNEQSVVRNESGLWEPALPGMTNDVNQEVVDDVLFYVSNLRAAGIECHNPKNLAEYGLDCLGTVLTLGLIGKEGIQKSLIIGFQAGGNRVYAMVQGQDVVFELDRKVVDMMIRSFEKMPVLKPEKIPSAQEDSADDI